MNTVIHYLKEVFGEEVVVEPAEDDVLRKVPFILTNTYALWKGKILNKQVYFAVYKGEELSTPDQFRKQTDLLENNLKEPVILVLKGMESYNRNRLIQKKVNFILENKQIFLPDLLVDLKDYLKPERERQEYLAPAAQYLLLFHLQKDNLNGFTYKQLQEVLPYNYLTITRAVEDLTSRGLSNTEGGKEKHLIFREGRKELWTMALPFLTSPVKKTVYINEELPEQFRILTNINALAHYTNIGDAPVDHFAISAKEFQRLHKKGTILMFSEYDGQYKVEQWKYNPILFGDEGYVDKLSLYLIFRNTSNERIEAELETMLERMSW